MHGRLQALTLVQGDTNGAVQWPASLDQYTAQLKKLSSLSFFAFDREAPQPDPRPDPLVKQIVLEYKALSEVGLACSKLKEAVAVFQDASEGEPLETLSASLVRFATRLTWSR